LNRIALKREDAVSKEMNKKFADDKKMTRKERDERFGVQLKIILLNIFITHYLSY